MTNNYVYIQVESYVKKFPTVINIFKKKELCRLYCPKLDQNRFQATFHDQQRRISEEFH